MSLPRPYYDEGGITLYHSDCREVLPLLSGLAACVTDPPYELGFMGKRWDAQGIAYSLDVWRGVLGALKPGAHLLAFGGTRTHHRMVCAVEDAGFEIRDEMQWLYGSGFPKSLDISKAIDKAAGAEREVVGAKSVTKATGGRGLDYAANGHYGKQGAGMIDITAPATAEAKQWDGWGTALKPACEPICVARKPLDGTVAANVLKHGTGGINVDGCRVGNREKRELNRNAAGGIGNDGHKGGQVSVIDGGKGRWPSNVLLSHAPGCVCTGEAWDCVEGCPVKLLDQQSGELTSNPGTYCEDKDCHSIFGAKPKKGQVTSLGDSGGASRFFYTAKASRSERGNDNTHPTVKPLDLMTYLCRLVTPPGGIILDPFAGSGTTLLAARRLGFRAIGIELDAAHCEIIASRLAQGALLL